MADIVVEIRGGVLVALYTDIPDARAVVIDWDNVESPDDLASASGPFAIDATASMPEDTAHAYKSAI